jgi:hypothetical protein
MNNKSSGASLMGLSGVKGSGASLGNILTHSQDSAKKGGPEEKKNEEGREVIDKIVEENETTEFS